METTKHEIMLVRTILFLIFLMPDSRLMANADANDSFRYKPFSTIGTNNIKSHHSIEKHWTQFKRDFINRDGRVIDYNQNEISHSEGQGYAMFLAAYFGDLQSFNQLWTWTKNHLVRQNDHLSAWSWGKDKNGEWQVLDNNNATDGDLLIAFALMQASKRWSFEPLKKHAIRIAQSILDKLLIEVNGRLFLLPGEFGFVQQEMIQLNPSYQILIVYRQLYHLTQDPIWIKIYNDAQYLIDLSFDETSNLPADWVWVNKSDGELLKRSNIYGYESVRVFLYQMWNLDSLNIRYPIKLFELFEKQGMLYSQFDFSSPDKTMPYTALSGIYQIYAELASHANKQRLSEKLAQKALAKLAHEKREYYGRMLYLLSQVEPL